MQKVNVPFSVIVPCYNEVGALPEAIEDLKLALSQIGEFELIIIDDGSTDGTTEILNNLSTAHPEIVVITHESNSGYGASLKTGIRHARNEVLVITDADGTYPHQHISELLSEIEENDMVVGSRTGENVEYSFIRKIPKYFLTHYASWIAGKSIPDLNSGLRVFKKTLAEKYLSLFPDGFSFTSTITLAHLTNQYRVKYVPIGYTRRIGKSKIRPIRDTLGFFQLIVRLGVYFAPLKVFGPIAVIQAFAFLVSFCYDIFVLKNITDKSVILLMFAMNTTFFALIADMIDKRSSN